MADTPFSLETERSEDAAAIEMLHETAFGPGRYARAAFRLREGVDAVDGLSFAAWTHERGPEGGERRLIGSIRFAPVELVEGSTSVVALVVASVVLEAPSLALAVVSSLGRRPSQ